MEHGVSFHAFADNMQLYVHCHRDEVTSAILQLQNCIEEVSDWMSANCLKLNVDKTGLLWAGSRHSPATLETAGPSLKLRTETVMASDHVHVLARQWRQTCLSTSTLPTFVRCASTGFVGSDGSDVHSMQSLRLCWSMLLWRHVWTTVKPFSFEHPCLLQTSWTASYESRCSSRQCHMEVRLRTHQSTARRASLAYCVLWTVFVVTWKLLFSFY